MFNQISNFLNPSSSNLDFNGKFILAIATIVAGMFSIMVNWINPN